MSVAKTSNFQVRRIPKEISRQVDILLEPFDKFDSVNFLDVGNTLFAKINEPRKYRLLEIMTIVSIITIIIINRIIARLVLCGL